MIIKIAKNSGFCFGVKRAISIAFEASGKYDHLVTLGPLIHNPQMVEKLASEGITNVSDLSEIYNKPVIIRSHGIIKEKLETLKKNKIEVIDATCPYVSKAQKIAKKLGEEQYTLIILGNKDHPEVRALKSYVEGKVYIVADETELPDRYFDKVGVICQTTQPVEKLQSLVNKLVLQSKELRIINTICNATMVRQDSTKILAKKSDAMIVIGGMNSSNTKMLAKICEKHVPTWHIETAEDLDLDNLTGKTRVGITAGASTPDWIILEVYNKIINSLGDSTEIVKNVEDIPGYKEDDNVCK